ncbi:MAG: PilT/PilU family type 4a pilus ATPase [Deltaproteobacteria bacterium]|nr:PilT/PilU family type 4a pilus ATPase [Deltaproteobacteria bacterium]
MELHAVLEKMVEMGASDLHIRVGRPPTLRIRGNLEALDHPPLKPEETSAAAESLMNKAQKDYFEKNLSVDIGKTLPGVARFRANIFRQRGSISIVFRNIAAQIPSIESLGLPQVIKQFCQKRQGLLLVTGPTGSGKSTTLATMTQYINETQNVHLITIEDPIEFLFKDAMATISQREVGVDTPNFPEALKNALRQDPDIILVGEMRDLEAISTAITASETGHLIFSTLHTNNASETISRIVDVFPGNQQEQVRIQLGNNLLGVLSQRLVPKIDGNGLIAAVEIMINTPKIRTLIIENRIGDIMDEIESSVTYFRMQSLEQSLLALVCNKMISIEAAETHCNRHGELKRLLNKFGIQKDSDDLKI